MHKGNLIAKEHSIVIFSELNNHDNDYLIHNITNIVYNHDNDE